MGSKPLSIFVYGTLKRGHCREKYWPCAPLDIRPGTTRGRLFDLGPYPALVPGDDPVSGELWRFGPAQIERTLAVLDRVEGYDLGDQSLYTRQVIVCYDQTGTACEAYAYLYARHHDLGYAALIRPNAGGFCEWTRN